MFLHAKVIEVMPVMDNKISTKPQNLVLLAQDVSVFYWLKLGVMTQILQGG